MNIRYAPYFKVTLRKMPENIRRKFYKQVRNLAHNIAHPSLRAKKYHESQDIWQARIDRHYRFYFRIENDTYLLLKITAHSD
mgnify:CR=1 FL=1